LCQVRRDLVHTHTHTHAHRAHAMAEPSQWLATINVRKTRGCIYSFWAPDDGWCVAWNMLSNQETSE
jgi:hypothetical protein